MLHTDKQTDAGEM